MGILKRTGQVAGHIVNVRVDKWLGIEYLGKNFSDILRAVKDLFKTPVAEYEESYEEAKERLNLTEVDIYHRKREFTHMFILYLVIATLIFIYSVFLSIRDNFMGFCMGLGVTVYALSHAFKYHFWLFQIKHKKLGCSLQDWLNAKD